MKWTHTSLPENHLFKSKVVVEWDEYSKGFWIFKTKIPAEKRVFYGDSTVWYEEDKHGNLSRAETSTERKLSDIQMTAYKMKYEKANP